MGLRTYEGTAWAAGFLDVPPSRNVLVVPTGEGARFPVTVRRANDPATDMTLASDRALTFAALEGTQLRDLVPGSQWLVYLWDADEEWVGEEGTSERGAELLVRMDFAELTEVAGGKNFAGPILDVSRYRTVLVLADTSGLTSIGADGTLTLDVELDHVSGAATEVLSGGTLDMMANPGRSYVQVGDGCAEVLSDRRCSRAGQARTLRPRFTLTGVMPETPTPPRIEVWGFR